MSIKFYGKSKLDIPLVLSEYYKGQEWTLNGDGYEGLIWSDENTLPKPTLEELTEKWNEYVAAQPLKDLRKERDTLLTKTDKYVIPDWPHASVESANAWVTYRQALRDLPSVTEDPANPVWPVRPDEVVAVVVVVEKETSNVVVEKETSNVVVEEETSNVVVEKETSNVVVEEETSNVVVEKETSNVVVEKETSNVVVEEETSNVVVE